MAVQGEKNPVVAGGLYRREQLTAAARPDSAHTEQNDVVLGRTCGKRLLKPSVFKSCYTPTPPPPHTTGNRH